MSIHEETTRNTRRIFARGQFSDYGAVASALQFSDVPQSKYFAEAVYDLARRNVIGGYPDGTFKPGNPITRGQAAAIIAKMIGLDTKNEKDPGFTDVTPANGSYKAIAAL